MRLKHVVMAAVCAATALLAGCSQACTLIGGLPGLVIQNPEVLRDLAAVEVKVCVTDTACATQPVSATIGDGLLIVETELLSRATTSVTISAADAQGAEVLRETRQIAPSVDYPNGKGCDPEVWTAAVTL